MALSGDESGHGSGKAKLPERLDAERLNAEAVIANIRMILQKEQPADQSLTLARLEALVHSMARDGARREQPMREVFARLGDKWSTLLMHLLRTGAHRHAVLRRLVSVVGAEGRISQRMLTLRLRTLERDGLISRRVISTHPPGVEYALTELGHSLTAQIETLMQWIRDHMTEIQQARQQFAAGSREDVQHRDA